MIVELKLRDWAALETSVVDDSSDPERHLSKKAGVGSVRKAQRGLVDEAPAEELKGGQRQTLGYNYPGANGYNYVAVGADGAAEVAFKIDLSLFLERLNTIPELQQVVASLIQKVDTLIYYVQGTGSGGGGGGGLSGQIIALEQSILARLEQQDAKVNALYQLLQQFQGELGTINQEINQILTGVQSIVGGGGSGGGGLAAICTQEMGVIQNISQQMMDMLSRILQIVERNGLDKTSSSVLEIVQQTYVLLQQCTSLIEQIGQQVSRAGSCPVGQGSATEMQILQEMSSVMNLLENIPQKVLILLQNSGLLGGPNGGLGGLVQYLQQIMQTCESLGNEILIVKNTLGECIQELRRYFAENQKSLTAVRKVVTETTEIVQSSAAAAISASRSMKCPSKNQKADLDE